MQSIYNGFSLCSQAFSAGVQYSREKNFVFDFTYTSSCRLINEASFRIFNYQLFDRSNLKTYREQKWEREVEELRGKIQNETVATFCRDTADCVDACVIKAAGETLRGAPKQGESWFFYWLGLPMRYAYRQLSKRGVRDEILNTQQVKNLGSRYNGFSTRIAHSLGGPTLRSLLHSERLLLGACKKIMNASSDRPFPVKEIVCKRLAKSLSNEKELERIWNGKKTEGEKKIAVLDWLKRRDDLPAGLPDPSGLLPENLLEKENEALYAHICKLIEKFLDKHAPESIRKGVTGAVYELEGKDAFVHLAAQLIIDVLIKQVADPHLFAQTILYSQGEVMDLELDGFGMGKGDDVFDAGHEILNSEEKPIHQILDEYKLKKSPGGQEANRQKEATRERLKEYFAASFMQMFESEKNEKTTFEPHQPIFGAGSIGWHFLMNTMNFGIKHLKSISFFAAEKGQQKISKYFAGRMVDLIYHPSWKIILLQMLEGLSENFFERSSDEPAIEKEDFDHMASFLGKHFFGSLEANQLPNVYYANTLAWVLNKACLSPTHKSLGELMSDAFLYMKSDELFEKFQEHINTPSTSKPFLEEGLEALIPTMRELLLHCRLTDANRKRGNSFDGDDKFWGVYLRSVLAQLTGKASSLEEKARLRGEIIGELLTLDEEALIERLRETEREKVLAVSNFEEILS